MKTKLPKAANPTITTSYAGEVLEAFLTLATTGNEVVEGGHAYVKSGIKKKFNIPRLRLGNIIQKSKATPITSAMAAAGANGTPAIESDVKGTFTIDENTLEPKEFMVYTEFNPREFEDFWRPFQPEGELVFRDLPAHVQVAMVELIFKGVDSYLGEKLWTGVIGAGEEDNFEGFITKAAADVTVIKVASPVALTAANIKDKLEAVRKLIPKAIRKNPNLKYFMSINSGDLYDEFLLNQPNKGANYTDKNADRYRGTPIVALNGFPDDCILCTVASAGRDSNLWIGTDAENDVSTVQVDKIQNNSEMYFFKMLCKIDTNFGWGQEMVLYKV